MLVEYRLRIRNAANSADALEVTSVRGGTNPYISSVPTGDGASLDPLTGEVTSGAFTGRIVDPITSGTSRLFTSLLEDADFRQQLGHRRAFWEFREDGGAWQNLYPGRLSKYRLVSDIEWEITVGDWMKAEHEFTVFDVHEGDTVGESADPATDYLARWPNRGCLLGGPVLGGFRGIRDLGGWTFRISHYSANGQTRLSFLRGYSPDGQQTYNGLGAAGINVGSVVNEAAAPFFVVIPGALVVEEALGPVDLEFGTFPDLAVLLYDTSGAIVGGQAHVATNGRGQSGSFDSEPNHLIQLGEGRFSDGPCLWLNGVVGTLDQVVRVAVISRKVDEASPIFWTGHPVDLLATLWTEAGLPYSASALETVRDTLGGSLRLTLRITRARPLGQFLEEAVYGPFGVGVRGNATGELEAFCSRTFVNTPPVTTIDEDDVFVGETQAFDLDADAAIASVVVAHERLIVERRERTDALFIQPERFERGNADPGSIGTGEQTYTVPGEIHFADTVSVDLVRWVDGRAHELFDRWGRGGIGAKTVMRRGGAGDVVKLGDEILVDLPQLPNHNKRLGDDGSVVARAMQVVHLTPLLRGKEVTLVDSGPNTQPYATVPTVTIAASTNAPRSVANATITNAATLNAADAGVRIQVAITTGAVPAAEDYSDALYFRAGETPTTAVALPAVFSDRSVYVRARAEKFGIRPSSWSAGVGVALDALEPPTSFNATADATDGSRCDLVWVTGTGSAAAWTEVLLRLSGQALDDSVVVELLAPGSVEHSLEDLTPGTAYIVTVRHVDPSTGDRSAAVDDTFTSSGTTVTFDAPTHPDGFSFPPHVPGRLFGRPINTPGSRYGIAVVATEHPSDVDVAEALETAPGAGTYGSYVTVGRVPSISGDWTMWWRIAPNDGLRRKLKARHVAIGKTPSAYTTELVVDPAVHDPIATYPIGSPVARVTLAGRFRNVENVTLDGALGSDATGPLEWRYKIGTGAYTSFVSTALPQPLVIPRATYYATPLLLEVRQADGQVSVATYSAPARADDSGGVNREDERRSGLGGLPLRRGRIPVDPVYSDDGLIPLVDTILRRVTTNLGDAEGRTGITSQYRARRIMASGVGAATQTVVGDGRVRAGSGGIDTPRGRFNTESLYNMDGVTPLIDPVTRTILSGLAIGPGVQGDSTVAFGATNRFPPTRHNEQFATVLDAESVAFGISYENPPVVRVLPQIWTLPGTSSTSNRKMEFKATGVTVAGATVRAVMSTGSSASAKTADFAATLNGTPVGAGIALGAPSSAAYCNLVDANGVETTYEVIFDVNTTAMEGEPLTMFVKAYKNDGTSSTSWTLVGSRSYAEGVNLSGQVISFVATLSANFDVRLVVTYSNTPIVNGSVTADRVEYDQITAGSEAVLTPAGSALLVQSEEGS